MGSQRFPDGRQASKPSNASNDQAGGIFPTTRVSLIENLKGNDNRSWKTFFEIYGPIAHRFARHSGLDEFGADEVLANVMRGLLQRVQGDFSVDHSRGRFRDYFRTIANREIGSYRKNSARFGGRQDIVDVLQPEDESADLNRQWEEIERQERFRTCMERLRATAAVRPRDVQAFERYAINNEPAKKVADEFGISTSRLYAIKHEMIRHLRRISEQLEVILGEI